jgi:hypothetical protein
MESLLVVTSRAHNDAGGKGQNTGGNKLGSRDSCSQQPIKGDKRASGFTEVESGMLQNVAEGARSAALIPRSRNANYFRNLGGGFSGHESFV